MVTLFNAHIRHTTHEGSHAVMEDHNVEGNIQRYHVYKTAWTPVIGQMLDVQAESANGHGKDCCLAFFFLQSRVSFSHTSNTLPANRLPCLSAYSTRLSLKAAV